MQLVKSVEGLVSEKEALAAREKAALGKMGYHVVPGGGGTPGRKRRTRSPKAEQG